MAAPEITTLPGGVRVVTERLPVVRSVALGYWVGVGSRDEKPERAGVSHFIEHMLFKGTQRYDALAIAELFDAMGGELNAATSRDSTVLYTRVPDSNAAKALEVMTEMVVAPVFAELDSEREVVLEEIAMVDDMPQDLVHDLAAEAVFGTHPLGRPVIGAAKVISSVSRRALHGFHAGSYVGGNVVLAAAGNVRHDRIVAQVAGALAPLARARTVAGASFRGKATSRRAFLERPTEQVHVVISGLGLARGDDRRFALSVLDAIVGGSASSRLFQEIREKRGMAYSVYSYTAQYAEVGQVAISFGTREENLRECAEITARELRALARGELRAGELERAKESLQGRLLLAQESTSNRMNRLGRSLISGLELMTLAETTRRIAAVTADDVAALAAELYAPESLAVAGIGPREKRFDEAMGALAA
ncbi:MAG: pitrilysin family protein [Gaiellales bacterium]